MLNSVYNPMRVSEMDKINSQLNIVGITSTFNAGVSTNLDLKLTDDMLLTGGSVIVKGHVFGDSITIQIVDKDNILGFGQNVVLNQFVSNWYVVEDSQKQIDLENNYPAKIYGNLYLRLIYHSTGINGGNVAVNFKLHKILV